MSKKYNYAMCTLFDSNYLDKGLVLYHSLKKVTNDVVLYVLAMNNECYEVLLDLDYKDLIPIKLSDFENEDLLSVKPTRSVAEYCWTCSSSLIKYVLQSYNLDYCSYIDADMAFYDDPNLLINELEEKNASVSIIGHRFPWYDKKRKSSIIGTYCVECNTFKNDDNGNKLLDIWIAQCLEHCAIDGDGIHWGDQKYMDNWCDDYDFVIESQLLGAGVAPWNVSQYQLCETVDKTKITLKCKGKQYNLLFYHFENMAFVDDDMVNMAVYHYWNVDDNLVDKLYDDYLDKIIAQRIMLKEQYGVDIRFRKHPAFGNAESLSFFFKVVKLFKSNESFWFTTLPSIIYRKKNIKVVTNVNNRC